jgi:hypothetical protein
MAVPRPAFKVIYLEYATLCEVTEVSDFEMRKMD